MTTKNDLAMQWWWGEKEGGGGVSRKTQSVSLGESINVDWSLHQSRAEGLEHTVSSFKTKLRKCVLAKGYVDGISGSCFPGGRGGVYPIELKLRAHQLSVQSKRMGFWGGGGGQRPATIVLVQRNVILEEIAPAGR